ncbi:Lipid binding protein [Phytophthora megakarya]|uniref:Lipid binding protein n=1 Tax=Phytophthora megakarya TaxID=4795 RepID=A0A225WI25_9STRA|nr:Lipid binding protein [Phytophthora megakarya]
MKRHKKPASAYQYYQKLVQDFDMLEREMESHQEEQSELEAQLERAKAKIQASKAENQQAQQVEWERERDRQLEIFIQQRSAIETLRAQTEALDDQELRLQAEMEVLRERIQETSETEARRIRRIVHERTTLLEDELTKGKLDLEYIAQVVSTGRRHELKQNAQLEANKPAAFSVQHLVQDIQERRRRDFETAEANFQARMRSFQLEKDELAKKAKEQRITKQRALQILSQNQQLAIKDFFASPPTVQEHVNTPSLLFGDILQSLSQSGSYIEQIQTIESERKSGRRAIADVLQEARTTLERGTGRIEAIQKRLSDRKAEAQKLGIMMPDTAFTGYDGAWGIESYSPQQYEMVYFIRGLVFSWMDTAIEHVNAEPTKELLEYEVNRWITTHVNVKLGRVYFIRGLVFSWMDTAIEHVNAEPTKELLESEVNRWITTHVNVKLGRDRDNFLLVAGQILIELLKEVAVEIASDIRSEFESNAFRVRNVFTNAFKRVLFPISSENVASPQTKKLPFKAQASTEATTHSFLFKSALDHLRVVRNRRHDPKSFVLLHHSRLSPLQRKMATVMVSPPASISPTKKLFGLFNVQRYNGAHAKKNELSLQHRGFTPVASTQIEAEVIPFLSQGVSKFSPSTAKLALTFWQNDPQLRVRTVIIPSSKGHCSCMQLSPNEDLLICGTSEGELTLWDLLSDHPTIIRVWSLPKAERSQITRVIFSPDAQAIIACFRRKTIGVFTINPRITSTYQKQATHSGDCFPVDLKKYTPQTLQLQMQISAVDALAELSFSSELREGAPNIVTKNLATNWNVAELSSGSFFESFSLIGMATNNISILCGTSTGDIVKVNLNPGGVHFHGIQAAFDSPGPEDTKSLNTKSIRREIFRGHRRNVIFVSCIHRESNESKLTEILSVDQDGIMCIWEYSTAKFTGFGWFEPSLMIRLELTCSKSTSSLAAPTSSVLEQPLSMKLPLSPDKLGSGTLTGEIVQVALTLDHTRLVCMVFYADPTKKGVTGTLRFLQIDTSHAHLHQVQLNVDFAGGNGAPRFALTTYFLLLLANNLVRVYILRTGNEAHKPIVLSTPGRQFLFNNISCSTSPKHVKLGSPTKARRRTVNPTTITFVVSSDEHSRLLVHSFTASTPQSPGKKANPKRER